MVPKIVTLFCIKNAENGKSKKRLKLVEYLMMLLKQRLSKCGVPPSLIRVKTFQNYLNHLILPKISSPDARYRWKTNQNMKKQTKTSEQQSTYLLQTIAENEKLRKDVARLQDERDILIKASAGVPVTLFSKSD